MAITRRQFLKRSGLVTAGTLLGRGLLDNPLVRRAFAETIGDRYLVVVYLDGGNDGLNTVVPRTNGTIPLPLDRHLLRDHYDLARDTGQRGLRLDPVTDLGATVVGLDPSTGAELALHPGFRGKPDSAFPNLPQAPGKDGLFHASLLGKIAVIQGCGYPEYSLSHEVSRIAWQTGDPLGLGGYAGTGWLGRHFAPPQYGGSDVPAITIDDAITGELRTTGTSVLAARLLQDLNFPYDGDEAAKEAAFRALYASAAGSINPTIGTIGTSGTVTLDSTVQFPTVSNAYLNDPSPVRQALIEEYEDYARRSLAVDLREVAKVIYGVENGLFTSIPATGLPRFFQVANGGYDTHSDQGGGQGHHFDLLAEVAAGINIFYRDLAAMGPAVTDKVCVVVWSEFSRRFRQNGNGTDHGSQGPMLVIGGKVRGGIYGQHPNIRPDDWDDDGNSEYTQDANAFRATDFRDVYGTILKHWVGMPHGQILSDVLQLDGNPDPAHYWNAENFDLKRASDSLDLFLP